MVFPSEAFEPEAVLAAIDAEQCTAVLGVPTMFIAEINHPSFPRYSSSTLRTGVMGGSPCPVELMRRVIADMHALEITICYGMTETSPVSFQTQIGAGIEERVTTVGRIHPHVEAKIVDATGEIVRRGQAGELLIRGYSVMRGYWDDAERTREAIDAAGWMRTGDLATLDDEGKCSIVGRVKDMIIRSGENIYPREIEELPYRHPKVLDVQVFGLPDPYHGEEVCAWIRLRAGSTATAEEIREFCRDHVAPYKAPRIIRFVEAFPTTAIALGRLNTMHSRKALIELMDFAMDDVLWDALGEVLSQHGNLLASDIKARIGAAPSVEAQRPSTYIEPMPKKSRNKQLENILFDKKPENRAKIDAWKERKGSK